MLLSVLLVENESEFLEIVPSGEDVSNPGVFRNLTQAFNTSSRNDDSGFVISSVTGNYQHYSADAFSENVENRDRTGASRRLIEIGRNAHRSVGESLIQGMSMNASPRPRRKKVEPIIIIPDDDEDVVIIKQEPEDIPSPPVNVFRPPTTPTYLTVSAESPVASPHLNRQSPVPDVVHTGQTTVRTGSRELAISSTESVRQEPLLNEDSQTSTHSTLDVMPEKRTQNLSNSISSASLAKSVATPVSNTRTSVDSDRSVASPMTPIIRGSRTSSMDSDSVVIIENSDDVASDQSEPTYVETQSCSESSKDTAAVSDKEIEIADIHATAEDTNVALIESQEAVPQSNPVSRQADEAETASANEVADVSTSGVDANACESVTTASTRNAVQEPRNEPKLQRRQSVARTEQNSLACLLCPYVGKTLVYLEQHYRYHETPRKVCRFCKHAFMKSKDRRMHEKKQHFNKGQCLPPGSEASPPAKQRGHKKSIVSPITIKLNTVPPTTTKKVKPLQISKCKAKLKSKQSIQAIQPKNIEIQKEPVENLNAEPVVETQPMKVPIRLDNYSHSVVTNTCLWTGEVSENNEIVLSLEPFDLDCQTDLYQQCPPVSSVEDMTEIFHLVTGQPEAVSVNIWKGGTYKPPPVITDIDSGACKRKIKRRRTESRSASDGTPNNTEECLPAKKEAIRRHSDTDLRLGCDNEPAQSTDEKDDPSPRKGSDGPLASHTLIASALSSEQGNPVPETPTNIPQKIKCTMCTFSTSSRLKMKHHQKAHEMKFHMCIVCYKAFIKKADMLRHMKATHGATHGAKPASSEPAELAQEYRCDTCNYMTNNVLSKRQHEKAHLLNQFICKKCSRAFISLQNLVYHWFAHNKKDAEGFYNCDSCPKRMEEKSALFAHLKEHFLAEHPVGNLDPGNADKKIKKKKERALVADKTYVCPECGVNFTLPSLLNWHRRKVHNVVTLSTFKCEKCNDYYSSHLKLRKHMMEVHQHSTQLEHKHGAKYSCETCRKTFSSEHYLKSHYRVHSGDHPYQCKGCMKTFPHHQGLYFHQRKCMRYRVSRAMSFSIQRSQNTHKKPLTA